MKSTIGERVRRSRDIKELDQATLAEKIGVVTRTLQRWEKGDQIPDGGSMTKIAPTAGVQASWLLTGEGEMFAGTPWPPNVYSLSATSRKNSKLVDLPLVSQVRGGKLATNFRPDFVDDY